MLRRQLNSLCKRAAVFSAALVAIGLAGNRAEAQAKGQEFTRQGLLIVNFAPRAGANPKLGKRASEEVRSRVTRLTNKESEIIDGGEIEFRMIRSGFDPDTTFTIADVRAAGQLMRADEYLWAWAANGPAGPTLGGELVLFRDEKLRQVIAPVTARNLDSAATLFAKAVFNARTQQVPNRRCENSLREGAGAKALHHAREGVAGYPRSVIARTCLMWAQRVTGAPAVEVLRTAREILAIDSTSVNALENAAVALDTLHRREEAATYWLRFAASDTSSIDLAIRVAYALLDGGNSKAAEPFIARMAVSNPDELRIHQLKWRIAYENKSWGSAIQSAEILLQRDSMAKSDSAFYLRLGMAYQANRKPFKAIETLAHGLSSFPADPRLYSLYTQYIRTEADTVIPRGLAMFPRSADLLALNAKDLRARGKVEESLKSTKMAVSIDSSIRQGYLQIAQLELQMARPDSALHALRRGLLGGEDSSLVAQFALAEGNTMYRAADTTKVLADYNNSLKFLLFADSVRSSPQSKFLMGAAALAVAQTVITAPAPDTDRVAGCKRVKEGADLIPLSRGGLQAGMDLLPEAAKQSLEYLEKLDVYAQQQIRTLCVDPPVPPQF
ncbi:MAG: hypothetical protein H7Z40_09235 [Phycisphaerae bacterium]|nr:hypothetical protein [Gemmatimonadaceae bacterium]